MLADQDSYATYRYFTGYKKGAAVARSALSCMMSHLNLDEILQSTAALGAWKAAAQAELEVVAQEVHTAHESVAVLEGVVAALGI